MKKIIENSYKDQFNYKFRRIKTVISLNLNKFRTHLVSFDFMESFSLSSVACSSEQGIRRATIALSKVVK